MTHIGNLRGILKDGRLKSYNAMRDQSYHSLANESVQQGRAQITVPSTGKALHDYVPLYFGFKTPMVAYNQDRNDEFIFLRVSLDILRLPGVVISDGNARAVGSKFCQFTGIDDLRILDTKAIQTVKYAGDSELKRKKQAEILIPDFLSWSDIFDIIVYSEQSLSNVTAMLNDYNTNLRVKKNTGWYFNSREKK